MPDKMTQEEAIEIGDKIVEDIKRNINYPDSGLLNPCLDLDKVRAIYILLPTVKKYEKVVGYLKRAIKATPGTEGKVSFCDGKIDAYEEIYELLTEED